MDIQKKKQDRFRFLHLIYETVKGRQGYIVDGWEIGNQLGFEKDYSTDIYYYLKDEQLVEPMGAGIRLSLTHFGIIEVEEALSEPEKPTEHFLPFNQYNTINIKNMNGGVVQQASNNSSINIVSDVVIKNIENYIKKLDKFSNEQVKYVDLQEEIKAEIDTIRQQIKSPKPKKTILKATLESVKDILVGATSGVIETLATPKAQELIKAVETLINQISN